MLTVNVKLSTLRGGRFLQLGEGHCLVCRGNKALYGYAQLYPKRKLWADPFGPGDPNRSLTAEEYPTEFEEPVGV